ncbi:MAG: hypothetical protein NZ765_08995 [Anaerolineae bacterium]|nr:hypothetical protein [Anaerolineae bacterium]MDW8070800.1 hypothetical protein [Anaerolineae bacterium]
MRHWVKLHTKILRNPAMGRLTWADIGVWTMLLALAGELEDYDADGALTGRLDTLENIAWHLHSSVEELTPIIEHLIQRGLLHCDADGVLYISDFAATQACDTPAARMQRYRQRKAATAALRECDATVTPPLRERDATVTLLPHERNTAMTPLSHGHNAAVTPALREVAESEQNQNRIRTEQNQNNIQNRTEQQHNRTDTEPYVVAVGDIAMNESGVNRLKELPTWTYRPGEWSAVEERFEAQSVMTNRAAEAAGAHCSANQPRKTVGAALWSKDETAAQEIVWDAERALLHAELIALGVDATMAAQLVQKHPPERIRAWCAEQRRQRAQGDAANIIVPRIARSRPPPHADR